MISSDAYAYGSGMASCESTRQQACGRYGDPRKPHLIRRRDQAPFVMAGLRETWRNDIGNHVESCTIVVTEANTAIRPIHDRDASGPCRR